MSWQAPSFLVKSSYFLLPSTAFCFPFKTDWTGPVFPQEPVGDRVRFPERQKPTWSVRFGSRSGENATEWNGFHPSVTAEALFPRNCSTHTDFRPTRTRQASSNAHKSRTRLTSTLQSFEFSIIFPAPRLIGILRSCFVLVQFWENLELFQIITKWVAHTTQLLLLLPFNLPVITV